jgi:hypothetical protein
LESVAGEVEQVLAVKANVLGFDTGSGMPQETGYRDLPNVWRNGFCRMEVDRVRSRLSRTELVLGDVATTLPLRVQSGLPAPAGFVAFDRDFHSSTAAAFRIFDGADPRILLPVLCYFDDIQSGDHSWHSEDVGSCLPSGSSMKSPAERTEFIRRTISPQVCRFTRDGRSACVSITGSTTGCATLISATRALLDVAYPLC